jgi:hypothetical protein
VNEHIDLKGLEKKAWRSAFQDGIWDIYFGWLFLGLAIAPFGDTFGLPAELGSMIIVLCWNSMAVLFLILGKKFITIPRMGFVKFGAKRKKMKKRLLAFLIFNVILAFLLLFINISGFFNMLNIGGLTEPLVVGLLLITVPLSILAYFLEFHRLYICYFLRIRFFHLRITISFGRFSIRLVFESGFGRVCCLFYWFSLFGSVPP